MAFPKTIFIRGIAIEVEDWEELDAALNRYGSDVIQLPPVQGAVDIKSAKRSRGSRSRLDPRDQALLHSFVTHNSLSVAAVGQAIGKQGKAIRSGLDEWARKIGLSDGNAEAFQRCFNSEGRAYRLVPHFKEVARLLLEGNE